MMIGKKIYLSSLLLLLTMNNLSLGSDLAGFSIGGEVYYFNSDVKLLLKRTAPPQTQEVYISASGTGLGVTAEYHAAISDSFLVGLHIPVVSSLAESVSKLDGTEITKYKMSLGIYPMISFGYSPTELKMCD